MFWRKTLFGLPSSFLSLLAYKKLKGFQIIGQRCWKHFVFFTSFKQMTVTNNDELTANSLTKNLKTILLSWVHKVLAHTLCLFVFFKKSPKLNTHLHIIIVPLIFNRITLLCTVAPKVTSFNRIVEQNFSQLIHWLFKAFIVFFIK